jgi:hypothetical protein
MPIKTSREVVAVFHDEESLRSAVDELLISGFNRVAINLLAGQQAVEATLRHSYTKVAELEDDPGVPRIAYVESDSRIEAESVAVGGLAYVGAVASAGAIVASGGSILATLLAVTIAGGLGGLIGAALAKIIDKHHAHYLQIQLEKGGLVLWVTVANRDQERRALEILKRLGADDVHVHQLPIVDYRTLQGSVPYDLSFMERPGL